jgi:hypothetical protein
LRRAIHNADGNTAFVTDRIVLWNGTLWTPLAFTEKSLALSGLTSGLEYDVFGYLSAGDLALELHAWLRNTVTISIATPGVVTWTAHGRSNGQPISLRTTGALPTGLNTVTTYYIVNASTNTFELALTPGGASIATSGTQSGTHTTIIRTTEISLQDGRYCKTGDKTRLWLGSIYTTASTTTEDSQANRYIANAYNEVARRSFSGAGASHTMPANQAIRIWNGGTSAPDARVICAMPKALSILWTCRVDGNTANFNLSVRPSLNGSGVGPFTQCAAVANSIISMHMPLATSTLAPIGMCQFQAVESNFNGTTSPAIDSPSLAIQGVF